MAGKLSWRIEGRPLPPPAGAGLAPGDSNDRRAPRSPAARPRPWSRRSFSLVLLAAMVLGFAFGRWTELEVRPWLGVRDSLELSRWALERGDLDLAARTLDPYSPAAWRQAELERQAALATAPGPDALLGLERLAPDLVRVRLDGATDGGAQETRTYRRRGSRWLQAPPDLATSPSPGSQP